MLTRPIGTAPFRSSPTAGKLTYAERFSRLTRLRGSQWRQYGLLKRRSRSEEMTYAEKFSRLRARLRDREWRQYGTLLLTGKAMGLVMLFMAIFVATAVIRLASGTPLFAQAAADPTRQRSPAT